MPLAPCAMQSPMYTVSPRLNDEHHKELKKKKKEKSKMLKANYAEQTGMGDLNMHLKK